MPQIFRFMNKRAQIFHLRTCPVFFYGLEGCPHAHVYESVHLPSIRLNQHMYVNCVPNLPGKSIIKRADVFLGKGKCEEVQLRSVS